jgi:SPP1 family phage portal protein
MEEIIRSGSLDIKELPNDPETFQYTGEGLEFTSEMIEDFIGEHQRDAGKFIKLYDLYKGGHDILERVGEPNKPNNKLVNDYYGQIIDTVIGYFMGNAVVFNAKEEKFLDALDDIFIEEDIDDLNMEVAKECAIKGKSAVLVYQDEEGNTRLAQIPAEEVIFIYDSSKTNKLEYAIRYYTIKDTAKDEEYRKVEVYTPTHIEHWIQTDDTGHFVPDFMEGNPVEPHIFGRVPIVSFVNNKEEQGDFEKIVSLVDDFDKVLSDASNEHEAYRRAYLMIKNMAIDDSTLIRLKQEGVIQVDDDGDVKFVTKEIQSDAIEGHLNLLEDNIYKFSRVPNLDDEDFAGNLSGIAIKFKLFGLETKCITKERKMRKGLKDLIDLICVPLNIKHSASWSAKDIEMVFTRNIPANITEQTDVVQKLQGIVDTETLLSLLPFIDDPAAVMEKLEEESLIKQKEAAIFGQAVPFGEVEEDGEQVQGQEKQVPPTPTKKEEK